MNDIAASLQSTTQKITTDDSSERDKICRHSLLDSKTIRSKDTPPPSSFPIEVRIWPQLTLWATQQNMGGAIRVWAFAKALDPSGSGVVEKSRLLSYLEWMNVSSASRYRWLRSAVQSGLLRPVRNDSQFLITSIHKTGESLDCPDIGPRCLTDAKTLTLTHWKSNVWDLILTQFKNRPVSRATLFQITGIPGRTQWELERFGLVQVHHNWCISNVNPALITPYTEFSRPHAFTAHIGKQTRIVYQLPNHYTVPKLSGTPDGGGYRRKTYTAASASAKSDTPEYLFSVVRFPESNFRDGGTRCGKIYRLYFDREKPFTRALKRLGRAEIEGTLYQKIHIPEVKTKNGWYREEKI
jgi:hypothetical protein